MLASSRFDQGTPKFIPSITWTRETHFQCWRKTPTKKRTKRKKFRSQKQQFKHSQPVTCTESHCPRNKLSPFKVRLREMCKIIFAQNSKAILHLGHNPTKSNRAAISLSHVVEGYKQNISVAILIIIRRRRAFSR